MNSCLKGGLFMNRIYFQRNAFCDCLVKESELFFSLSRFSRNQDFCSFSDSFSKCYDFLCSFSQLSQEQKLYVLNATGFACSVAGGGLDSVKSACYNIYSCYFL